MFPQSAQILLLRFLETAGTQQSGEANTDIHSGFHMILCNIRPSTENMFKSMENVTSEKDYKTEQDEPKKVDLNTPC